MSPTSSTNIAARVGTALVAITCALGAHAVQAAPLHHHHYDHSRLVIPHSDFNAYAEPALASAQVAPSPVMGTWRFGVLRHGCGHGYPMTESAGCGTATGGPAGGIN